VANWNAERASAASRHAAVPRGVLHGASVALCGALLLLTGCATSHPPAVRPPRADAPLPATHGPLASLDTRFRAEHDGSAGGFLLLQRNEDALQWRIALVDAAVQSLDLQYYIWWGDESGDLLMKHVVDAADRGVRVRLILDDVSTLLKSKSRHENQDWATAKLDAHPNIQVRLFNASHSRSLMARSFEFLAHSDQLNQRMHNKVMIADNRAMIVGGRNIGNEYFGLSQKSNFLDLDVLGVGEVAQQASGVFDRFWNSTWVTPVATLKLGATTQDLRADAPQVRNELETADSVDHFALDREKSPLAGLLQTLRPGNSQMLSDKLDEDVVEHQMAPAIRALMLSAQRELLITNSYVIPDDGMVQLFHELTSRGVRIRILTNSLASLDVPAVNSHYKTWRRRLLDAGVDLYEMRADAAVEATLADTPPTHAAYMGLHVKSMVVDRQTVFVGSMNLDPRSSSLNSEMGVVIHSPSLASELADYTEQEMLPANSWRLSLDTRGDISWTDAVETIYRQPARSGWQRVEGELFMILPRSLY
jgi:putative cardiolipin synthase